MFLTAGYYGQHRFESMETSCGLNIGIENRKFKIVLKPKSLVQIKFKLTRNAYKPVSNPLEK